MSWLLGNKVDSERYSDLETDLTPRGEMQEVYVAKRLAHFGSTHVVSSLLSRSMATAQLIADQADIETIDVWMNLSEGNHGEYVCQPRNRLQQRV